MGPTLAAGPGVSSFGGIAYAAGITKGPWVQRVTDTSAVVRVEVDPPSPVTLEILGPDPSAEAGAPVADDGGGCSPGGPGCLPHANPSNGPGGRHVVESGASARVHSINLTGLFPNRRHTYAVRAHGTSRQASFMTAPDPSSKEPFRFSLYGDNRTDDSAHGAVVRAMVPVATEFLVHTGDFVEDGGSARQWQTFFDLEAPLLRERCLFSAVGNHELVDGAGTFWIRYFGPTDPPPTLSGKPALPEHLNGTFRWGNTRFFLLNGGVGYRKTADQAWLDKALADADVEPGLVWRVAVVHFGPWSSGPHGNNPRFHEASLPDLLRQHKVDAIFSGHDHIYERGFADGLAYVVSGGGGAPTYKVKKTLPTTTKIESVRHFVEFTVTPEAMQLVARRVDGSILDTCSLRKGAGWDCDEAAASPAGSGAVVPAPPPPASRCGCRVAGDGDGDGGTGTRSLLAGIAVAIGLFARRRRALLDACARSLPSRSSWRSGSSSGATLHGTISSGASARSS